MFKPACAQAVRGTRRSQPAIVGGAVLEWPSAKIRPRNLRRLPFCENWTPRKFPAIRYVLLGVYMCVPLYILIHSCILGNMQGCYNYALIFIRLHVFMPVYFIILFLAKKPPCIFEDFEIQFPDPTTIQDSHKLHQAVAEIGNWRGLCENLKVDRGTMDMLKYSNDQPEYKKSDCLNAYFDKGDAVWEEVVLAVAQHPVDEVDIARNIANKYLQEHNLAVILKLLKSCN